MTTEEIIKKYPKIFEDYESNPGRCNWHGVPTGWLSIIDDLCGAIQNYIDTYKYSIKNPEYIEGSVWDKDDITTYRYLQKSPDQVTCTQMKEKFGGLRFYAENTTDIIEGIIHYAEYLADNTCQDCGSRDDLGHTSGWITVLCRNCAIANGDRAMAGWKSINI